jgi:hypothetical protein
VRLFGGRLAGARVAQGVDVPQRLGDCGFQVAEIDAPRFIAVRILAMSP